MAQWIKIRRYGRSGGRRKAPFIIHQREIHETRPAERRGQNQLMLQGGGLRKCRYVMKMMSREVPPADLAML